MYGSIFSSGLSGCDSTEQHRPFVIILSDIKSDSLCVYCSAKWTFAEHEKGLMKAMILIRTGKRKI